MCVRVCQQHLHVLDEQSFDDGLLKLVDVADGAQVDLQFLVAHGVLDVLHAYSREWGQIDDEDCRGVLVHGGRMWCRYARALPVCGRSELALAREAHPEDHTLVSE